MSQAPQFVISEFTNPSGEIVFRLIGWLDGKRIRKNVPTRAEVGAVRQAMDLDRIKSPAAPKNRVMPHALFVAFGLMYHPSVARWSEPPTSLS